MAKKIQLNETSLKQVIKESINKVIRESMGNDFDSDTDSYGFDDDTDSSDSYDDNYDDNMDDRDSDMAPRNNNFKDMFAGEKMFTVKFNGQPYWTKVPGSYIEDRGIEFFQEIADERIGPGTKVEIVPENATHLNEARLKQIIKESVAEAMGSNDDMFAGENKYSVYVLMFKGVPESYIQDRGKEFFEDFARDKMGVNNPKIEFVPEK